MYTSGIVTITFNKTLAENMVLLQYRGRTSNIYFVIDTARMETSMVDCGVPSDIEGLVKILRSLPPLKRVAATHFHIDHVSGWIRLKRRFPQAVLWLHEEARVMVEGKQRIPIPTATEFFEIILPCQIAYGYCPNLRDVFQGGLYATPFMAGFPPEGVRFFTGSPKETPLPGFIRGAADTEGAPKETPLPGFTVIHTPGHRPDSVSFLHRASGTLLTGDFLLVIKKQLIINPYVSSRMDQDRSVETIKQMEGIRLICPGHGACLPFDSADLV